MTSEHMKKITILVQPAIDVRYVVNDTSSTDIQKYNFIKDVHATQLVAIALMVPRQRIKIISASVDVFHGTAISLLTVLLIT